MHRVAEANSENQRAYLQRKGWIITLNEGELIRGMWNSWARKVLSRRTEEAELDTKTTKQHGRE